MAYTPVYPEGIDRAAYEKALESCVMGGGWLFNQSGMDVWFDFDGFTVKIPAGTKVRPDGWENIRSLVEQRHTEKIYGQAYPVSRSGFQFVSNHLVNVFDSLVVFSPDSARHWSILYGQPQRSLEEHIALINGMGLDRVTVVAEDLSFLSRCPGLRHLHIVHAETTVKSLDFSPVYTLLDLESIEIQSSATPAGKGPAIRIDLSRLTGLRDVRVWSNDPYNYHLLPRLDRLSIGSDKRHRDMTNISCSPSLMDLDLEWCGTRTLDGIGRYPLQRLTLLYLRRLEDISALSGCAYTLRSLSIEGCNKITDFSCLHRLHNLEILYLKGGQVLPDLSFLENMPRLRVFIFSMTVENGDLTPCLDVPYVYCSKIKRHYNLKDKDLPRDKDALGFELI